MNYQWDIQSGLSLIAIVVSAFSFGNSFVIFWLYERKLNKMQQKDLVFKYSPYPRIDGLYINPQINEPPENSDLLYCQKLTESDLKEDDKTWIREHGKSFAYRVFNGTECFVWKLEDSSESGYKVSHSINTLVLRNSGERMVSAEINELRLYNSSTSQECLTYEGSGTIHRFLQQEGQYDKLEIPLTVISYNDEGGCAEEEPYIGINLLENPCVRNLFTWEKLEIDITVQNIMGEKKEYTLSIVYSDRQVYTETFIKD